MTLVIDDPDLERDLRALAAQSGEHVEDVLRQALLRVGQPEHAPRQPTSTAPSGTAHRAGVATAEVPVWLKELQARFRRDSVNLDSSDDELLGYDEDGFPS